MVVVLTRWGDNDLVEMFRELGFVIVTMPALGYWDRRAVCPNCGQDRNPDLYAVLQRCEHCDTPERPEHIWGEEPLWATQESKETLLQRREDDPIIFDLVHQGDPKAVAGNVFDVKMLNHGVMPGRNEFERVVQYVDTAGGKDRKKGDYFAIVTLGLRKNGQEIWVMDVVRDRIPAPEQERMVIQKGRDPMLRPDRVYIELKNEGTALYQRLIISPEVRLPLEGDTPVEDKEWRAIPFANVVNAGRVWIPANRDGVPNFEIELAGFPGRHDDQVDAAAGAYSKTTQSGPRVRVLRAGAV
jgi:predicted phage terminase large subunit-like protein